MNPFFIDVLDLLPAEAEADVIAKHLPGQHDQQKHASKQPSLFDAPEVAPRVPVATQPSLLDSVEQRAARSYTIDPRIRLENLPPDALQAAEDSLRWTVMLDGEYAPSRGRRDKVRHWRHTAMPVRGLEGRTFEEYRAAAEAHLQSVVAKGEVRVRVDDENLLKVLEDGRFKNQYETGTSGGGYIPGKRKRWENNHVPGAKSGMPLKERPIYGYVSETVDGPYRHESETGLSGRPLMAHPELATRREKASSYDYRGRDGDDKDHKGVVEHDWPATRGVGQYGDVVVTLKDEAKDRTTVTFGDSLNITSTNYADTPEKWRGGRSSGGTLANQASPYIVASPFHEPSLLSMGFSWEWSDRVWYHRDAETFYEWDEAAEDFRNIDTGALLADERFPYELEPGKVEMRPGNQADLQQTFLLTDPFSTDTPDFAEPFGLEYIEAQVVGGVEVSDIASVHFASTPPTPELTSRLDELGIPWTVHERYIRQDDGTWLDRVDLDRRAAPRKKDD